MRLQNREEDSTLSSRLRRENREKDALLMTFAFLVSWAPLGLVYCTPLLGFVDKDSITSNILPLLGIKFGCAVFNPLVYIFENSKVNVQQY